MGTKRDFEEVENNMPSKIRDQCDKLFSMKKYDKVVKLWKDHIFPKDMTPAEVESEWYKALFEEDCLRIMRLLKIDPTLVKVGWKSEPSRNVEGRPGSHRNPKVEIPWKGRTAVHVSARRGCTELLKQVLELYGKLPSMYVEVGSEEVASSSSDSDGSSHDTGRNGKSAGGSAQATNMEGKSAAEQREEIVSFPHDDSASQHDQANEGESAERAQEASSIEGSSGIGVEEAVLPLASSLNVQVDSIRHFLAQGTARARNSLRKLSNLGKGAERHRKENAADFSPGPRWRHKGAESDWNGEATNLPPRYINLTYNRFQFQGEEVLEVLDTHTYTHTYTSVTVSGSYRKDLLDLLVSKDGTYEIDALAIATIHYNPAFFNVLVYALGEIGSTNPYGIGASNFPLILDRDEDDGNRLRLRQASKAALSREERLNPAHCRRVLKDYVIYHRDFNFAFLEYLFHYSFTSPDVLPYPACRRLWEEIRSCGETLWRFVLELQDAQGRTPVHVAADEGWQAIINLVHFTGHYQSTYEEDLTELLKSRSDAAGRTPAYRAVAQWGLPKASDIPGGLAGNESAPVFDMPWESYLVSASTTSHALPFQCLQRLSTINGLGRLDTKLRLCTRYGPIPLHAGIIRRNSLSEYNQTMLVRCWSSDFHKTSYIHMCPPLGTFPDTIRTVTLDALEVACLVGGDRSDVVSTILETGYLARPKAFERGRLPFWDFGPGSMLTDERLNSDYWARHPFQALHITAARGDYKMLKMFIDNEHCDPFVEDFEGNSALHYALGEPFETIDPPFFHYVSCEDLLSVRAKKEKKDFLHEKALLDRQGCVTLLLQVGCEIFKVNKKGQIPYPQGSLNNNVIFCSWWFGKQEKEFAAITSNLNTATNAIAVTATLVATASYIGPMQPPLSYAPDPTNNVNQIQYENGWVATFLFCDTLSFYLAIIAIVLSLIPSLPVPQQPMVDELRRSKAMIIMAVSVLIPSIICVLIAFASSSMAVVSTNIVSSLGGRLTIATLCICGPFLLGTFFMFLIRLLYILFPRTPWIRYYYKRTSF